MAGTLKIRKLEAQIKKLNKKVSALENQALITAIEHDRDMTKLNHAWSEKFDLLSKMLLAQMDTASTLGEVKRWYQNWLRDIGSIDCYAEDAGEQMDKVISNHGFEISRERSEAICSYKEMI